MDRVSKIKSLDELPISFIFPEIPDLKIRADHLRQAYIPQLKAIWDKAASTGDGISNEEGFGYLMEIGLKKSMPGYVSYVLVDESSEKVIAMHVTFPSKLCRSERPVYCGGFLIVNEAYRSQRVAFNLLKFLKAFKQAGVYYGLLARACVIARSIVPSVRTGGAFLGVIPWCSYMEGRGWFHDVIVHEKFKEFEPDIGSGYIFPALGDRRELEASLLMFKRLPVSRVQPSIRHKVLGNLRVDSADTDGIWMVQGILRQAAKEGDGLGLDEFTADGVFNEKHILNCRYWLVRSDADRRLVAVVLSGENGHGRSCNKHTAGGFILIVKQFRHQGLGRQLLQYCEDHCAMFGYKYILSDVLACNTGGLALMRKSSFTITGTFPNSCLVRNQVGYTDCYLHWKELPTTKL